MERFRENIIYLGIGAIIIAATVVLDGYINPIKTIPATEKVASGYVIPAKIEEIEVKDINCDGKLEETVIKYKGKTLLFKEKANGGLEANPFDIQEKNY